MNNKFISLILSVIISVFMVIMILLLGLKAVVILGGVVFLFVFFIKMEYAFCFLLASRSIVDIFYNVEMGDVKITQYIGVLTSILFLFYLLISEYDFLNLRINKIYMTFLAFSGISLIFSDNLMYAVEYWLKLFQVFLFFNMAILLLLKSDEGVMKQKVNRVLASIMVALVVPYWLFARNYIHGTSIVMGGLERYSTIGSYTNLFSYYLLIVLPFFMFYYSVSDKHLIKKYWLIGMGILLLTIYKTYTRNVWIGVVIFIFAWNLARRNFKIICSLLGLTVLVYVFNPVIQNRFKDMFSLFEGRSFFSLDPTLLSYRIGIWQSNIRYFIDKSTMTEKIFGNSFDIVEKVTNFLIEGSIPEHNNYLTLLMATGVCGLTMYLLYIVELFNESFDLLRRTRDIYMNNLAKSFIAFLFSYVVVSVFTHIVWKMNFQYYFSTFAGLIVAANILEKKKTKLA